MFKSAADIHAKQCNELTLGTLTTSVGCCASRPASSRIRHCNGREARCHNKSVHYKLRMRHITITNLSHQCLNGNEHAMNTNMHGIIIQQPTAAITNNRLNHNRYSIQQTERLNDQDLLKKRLKDFEGPPPEKEQGAAC